MNANELTALIGECLRETDDHDFFLKLESVLRQQQAEIDRAVELYTDKAIENEALKKELYFKDYYERHKRNERRNRYGRRHY